MILLLMQEAKKSLSEIEYEMKKSGSNLLLAQLVHLTGHSDLPSSVKLRRAVSIFRIDRHGVS